MMANGGISSRAIGGGGGGGGGRECAITDRRSRGQKTPGNGGGGGGGSASSGLTSPPLRPSTRQLCQIFFTSETKTAAADGNGSSDGGCNGYDDREEIVQTGSNPLSRRGDGVPRPAAAVGGMGMDITQISKLRVAAPGWKRKDARRRRLGEAAVAEDGSRGLRAAGGAGRGASMTGKQRKKNSP